MYHIWHLLNPTNISLLKDLQEYGRNNAFTTYSVLYVSAETFAQVKCLNFIITDHYSSNTVFFSWIIRFVDLFWFNSNTLINATLWDCLRAFINEVLKGTWSIHARLLINRLLWLWASNKRYMPCLPWPWNLPPITATHTTHLYILPFSLRNHKVDKHVNQAYSLHL